MEGGFGPPLEFLRHMRKTIEIDLTYSPTIDGPPGQQQQLYSKSTANDGVTVNSWKDIWIRHTKANKERFKEFSDYSIGKLYGINKQKPAIICGSGPSLKDSIEALRENAQSMTPVMTVSCLHNFGYFEDEGFHADFYLTLDSGEIVVEDVSEGRKEKAEYYWEKTKGKKLLATVMTDPKVLELWQGEIYLFNVMIPELEVQTALKSIEHFTHYVSCGGNALGGVFYVTKSIFCSDTIHFVGADFCFDYNDTFHSYSTHYDKVGQYVSWPDVYGIRRKSWASYMGFKFWFDWVACNVPGRYVNCSGGLLGAYPEGNIKQFQYMSLKDALLPYRMMDKVFRERVDATSGKVIEKVPLELKDFYSNSKFEYDLVFF